MSELVTNNKLTVISSAANFRGATLDTLPAKWRNRKGQRRCKTGLDKILETTSVRSSLNKKYTFS